MDDDLFYQLVVLFVLGLVLVIITVVGHGIWLIISAIFRAASRKPKPVSITESNIDSCAYCGSVSKPNFRFCGVCGRPPASPNKAELLNDLAATRRQLQRWSSGGVLDDDLAQRMTGIMERERERLFGSSSDRPPVRPAPSVVEPLPVKEAYEPRPTIEPAYVSDPPWLRPDPVQPSIFGRKATEPEPERRSGPAEMPPPVAPAKPLAQVIASFMEQSNIRWGEIIGGLLIVGCSTALVVSLWNEIAQIPLLKFLIFTGVTAVLFGVGFYTEHRWKLPTTSQGILTIATLLVPLNFLAIAAVSSGTNSGGWPVLVSELLAPAVFACLVFYAGRVLTPKWPHLLAGGMLITSVGQLLVRHFAVPELNQATALLLTVLPIAGCVFFTAFVIRRASRALVDDEVSGAIFLTLGANVFATVLPLGLMLYKTGNPLVTLMLIAPALALLGLPLLAVGIFLWRELTVAGSASARTAATAVAILGGTVSLVAMLAAWPNPASVVPAALINVALWSYLAWTFRIAFMHYAAAFCLTLAASIVFPILSGNLTWQLGSDQSLLARIFSGYTGEALVGLMVIYFVVAEFALRRERPNDANAFLVAGIANGILGGLLAVNYGFDRAGDPRFLTITLTVLALGGFWSAYKHRSSAVTWISAGILWLAVRQAVGPAFGLRFPWQTATFVMATLAAVIPLVVPRLRVWRDPLRISELRSVLVDPFKWIALVFSGASVFMVLQAQRWEPTAMVDARLFWLSSIWFALLWSIRSRWLFAATQGMIVAAVALSVKLLLQNFEWYSYLPNAFLHPWSLQIQGGAIIVTGWIWLALRTLVPRAIAPLQNQVNFDRFEADFDRPTPESSAAVLDHPDSESAWSTPRYYLHHPGFAFDRFLTIGVAIAFSILSIYGALPGIAAELSPLAYPLVIRDLAGFPHTAVFGAGAWILSALILIALLANGLVEGRRKFLVFSVGVFFTWIPLVAARWETVAAAASAWRWLAVLFLVLALTVLWQRQRLTRQLESWGIPRERISGTAVSTQAVALFLGIFPLVLFTLQNLQLIIQNLPAGGPTGGLFLLLGSTLSYTVPLVAVTAVLMGFAWRERSSGFAFAAGVSTMFTVITAHLVSQYASGFTLDRVTVIQAFQLAAISASGFVLVWLATRHWWMNQPSEIELGRSSRLTGVLLGAAFAALAGFLVPIALRLFFQPTFVGVATIGAGSIRGWLAWALTLGAVFWWVRAFDKRLSAWSTFAFTVSLAALIAFASAHWSEGRWISLHIFQLGMLGAAVVLLLIQRLPRVMTSEFAAGGRVVGIQTRFPRLADNWSSISAVGMGATILLTTLLSLRASTGYGRPWWAVAPILGCVAVVLGFNAFTGQRKSVYAAWSLAFLSVNVWFFTELPIRSEYFGESYPALTVLMEWISANAVAISIVGLVSLLVELRNRQRGVEAPDPSIPSFHKVAAFVGLASFVTVVAFGLAFDTRELTLHPRFGFAWINVTTFILLVGAMIWDRTARYAVALVYLGVLGAMGVALDQLNLPDYRLVWVGLTIMAVYAVVTSSIWRTRSRWPGLLDRLRIPERVGDFAGLNWLLWFNAGLVVAVLCLGTQIVTMYVTLPLRILAAVAVTLQVITLGNLAAGKWRPYVLRTAAAVFALGCVLLSWSLMNPLTVGTWLNRSVAMMVMLLVFLTVCGFGRERIGSFDRDWSGAADWLLPKLAVASGFCLAFVLTTEVAQEIEFGQVMTGTISLIIVALTLLAAIVLAIYFALNQARDPLQLSERWRPAYVYAAEGLLALLFLHIRLSLPQLFTGFFAQYWPYVVVVIAFAGVWVSEILRRRGSMVLATPIERTGAFLPLLPAIAFWLINSRAEYSALLLSVGLVYAILSILRRSFGFGLLAALAANGGLWFFLGHTGTFHVDQHPQVWFIPAALSVLIAGQINRERLTSQQLTALRYSALSVVYVSSTADIFLNGVAESPWLPLVLAAISVTGVLCGVAFRIRAFLIMGATFLLIAITTMIRYAQVSFGWTWLWYIAGIVAGGLILLTFALFEKRRRELAQETN
ncbi:MAG: hypothetical protein ABIP75_18795 [Pyrinomonadaceae bacterium]